MISGNINLENSIITNNNGGETGGSFYIQQPMYDAKTVMNIHNNIITNNTSPYGQEIFIKWKDTKSLYTKLDNNDWGDENPNDPSVIDPNHVTDRSHVSSTIKSNLFSVLNLNHLDKYDDLIKDFFPENSLDTLKSQFKTPKTPNQKENNYKDIHIHHSNVLKNPNVEKNLNKAKSPENNTMNSNSDAASNIIESDINQQLVVGNSTSYGEDSKAYELNKTNWGDVAKQSSLDIEHFIAMIVIVLILLIIGYRRNKRLD